MTEFTAEELKLDQHIRECDMRMIAACAAGDRKDVNEWRDRMYAAIKSRTPEHQAKMTARIDSAIWFQGSEAQALGESA